MAAIYLTSSWLAGVFIGSLVEFPRELSFLLVGLTAITLWYSRKCSLLVALLSLAVFVLGMLRYDAASAPAEQPFLTENQGRTVELRGIVASEPRVGDRYATFVLEVSEFSTDSGWSKASGKVLVSSPRHIERVYGEFLELQGKLEEPRNFADFDYKAHLARQGIHYQIQYPQVISRQPPAETDVLGAIYSLKRRLSRGLDLALPEPQASLAKGVLLGSRASLPEELRSAFESTNTSHVLAISGWNITLLAGFLRLLGGRMMGRTPLVLFVIAGIGFYTALVGPQPSVLRAALMGALLLLGEYVGRPSDAVVGLLLAASAMTAFDPYYLWDVGFQLSFASTVGIVLLVPPLQRTFCRLPSWLADSMAVTVAAQLATLPIIAVVFGKISALTTLANLLILPAMLPIMLLTALTAFLALLWLPLAQASGLVSWIFLTYMIRAVELLAAMPFASVTLGRFAPALAVPYYALLGVLFARREGLQRTTASVSKVSISLSTQLALASLAVACVLVWVVALQAANNSLRVTFFDVGQGDAIFLETPEGRRVLIDGGPSPPRLLDALGRRMPFWSKTIDLVILTHANDDHLAGLIEVLERFDVGQVLEPRTAGQSAGHRKWEEIIQTKGIARIEAEAGQEIDLGRAVSMRVLHPPFNVTPRNANESSVVIRLIADNVPLLLTGDVDPDSQQALVGGQFDLASTLLKVPHHGAQNALHSSFIRAVKPSVAVISVGKDNQFGHPAPELLAQLQDVQVLRTDLDGDVEVVISDGRYEIMVAP